jgi:hypothetical protein
MATNVEGTNQGNVIQLPSRVSVRAVLSGFVVAAALVLLTTVLGAAIFLSGMSPSTESVKGMTIGFYIWTLVFFVVSAFCGAFVAASASQSQVRRNGALHGLLVWGLLALSTSFLLGGVMSSTMGSVLSLGGTAATAVAQSTAINRRVEAPGMQRQLGHAVQQATKNMNAKDVVSTAASVGGLSMWAFFLLLALSFISSLVGGGAAIGFEQRTALKKTIERPQPTPPVFTPPQPAT